MAVPKATIPQMSAKFTTRHPKMGAFANKHPNSAVPLLKSMPYIATTAVATTALVTAAHITGYAGKHRSFDFGGPMMNLGMNMRNMLSRQDPFRGMVGAKPIDLMKARVGNYFNPQRSSGVSQFSRDVKPFIAGGLISAGTVGALALAVTRSGGPAAFAAGAAFVAGGFQTAKMVRRTTSAVATSFRDTIQKNSNLINQPPGHVVNSGPGNMLWMRRTGRIKPGHLGTDGALVHSMHKIRHRSVL